ncbi:hypothetical protein BC830DRAFT_1159296 [Chytriomyces sp. MP71]|nr:hypothetical protein BC830DRAFT_1159296 [Chytriomyces sp. MP71]
MTVTLEAIGNLSLRKGPFSIDVAPTTYRTARGLRRLSLPNHLRSPSPTFEFSRIPQLQKVNTHERKSFARRTAFFSFVSKTEDELQTSAAVEQTPALAEIDDLLSLYSIEEIRDSPEPQLTSFRQTGAIEIKPKHKTPKRPNSTIVSPTESEIKALDAIFQSIAVPSPEIPRSFHGKPPVLPPRPPAIVVDEKGSKPQYRRIVPKQQVSDVLLQREDYRRFLAHRYYNLSCEKLTRPKRSLLEQVQIVNLLKSLSVLREQN